VAALPVPYRTSDAAPTMETLRRIGEPQAFPIALEPFMLTRFEMAEFARTAKKMGVNYIREKKSVHLIIWYTALISHC
jgi:hypothetical protein